MTIYSWNMFSQNKRFDRALEFVTKSNFDVFCLQEVPEYFLERLRKLPYHLSYRVDAEWYTSYQVKIYLVILSKHPVVAEGFLSLPDYWHLMPMRARAFVYLMRLFHFARMYSREILYADLKVGERYIRVFNMHLPLMHPTQRLKEFEVAMAERDPSRPAIVCGDFNVLEKPHITILNWLFGGKISDALFYRRERTHIEKRFVEHSLTNALRGAVTHPLSQSQLDHILVPHEFSIKNAEVLKGRMGSDHRPIRVEIA